MSEHRRVTIDADVTPRFTACYLRLAGDECAFIEAHTNHALPRLLAALAAERKKPEDVRYVIVTHAHLDHAAGASALIEACPKATLLAHPRTAKHMISPDKLIQGAKAVYGEARFAELYGEVKPIPADRVRALGDGESFELGSAKLSVHHTSGHAFHHFVVDDPAIETCFTGDTFGLVYPALQTQGRFALPSTSPTGFHAALARESIERVLALGEKWVCLTHFDGYEDSRAIADQLLRFIDRADRWVTEAARGTETLAEIEARLTQAWWEAVKEEAPHFGEREKQLLTLDLELNAQGLAVVADGLRTKS